MRNVAELVGLALHAVFRELVRRPTSIIRSACELAEGKMEIEIAVGSHLYVYVEFVRSPMTTCQTNRMVLMEFKIRGFVGHLKSLF